MFQQNTYGPDTEELLRRLANDPMDVNLSSLHITHLPPLPDSIRILNCGVCPLTELPPLPPRLRTLICSYSDLQSLPRLPDTLRTLWCNNTLLHQLPCLPESLQSLCIDATNITTLHCPPQLVVLIMDDDCVVTNLPPTLQIYERVKKLKNHIPPYPPATPLNHMATTTESGWDESTLTQPSTLLYNVHTPFQHLPTEVCKKAAQRLALPVGLLLLNLDGNMNIGMSIRTAAVLGCSDVWVVGKRKYDRRSEVGARNYINVHRIQDIETPATFFEELGWQPILVEQGGVAVEDYKFPLTPSSKPIVFIMGSESHGIPTSWLTSLQTAPRLSISQYGLIRSLNVSAAASIILYEYTRQWRKARLMTL